MNKNSVYLKDFACPRCQQAITEPDINNKNYFLRISQSEINQETFISNKSTQRLKLYLLISRLEAVEHYQCPPKQKPTTTNNSHV